MGRKRKKVQKMRKHEYVIFAVGGILAVAAAIFAAYYSAQLDEADLNGFWVRIDTGTYIHDGLIYGSESGKLFKEKLPITAQGFGADAILRISVEIPVSVSSSEFIQGAPGEIIYDSAAQEILILGDIRTESRKAIRLGSVEDYQNLNWTESTAIQLNIELK
jgi:hypothetical protein